MKTVQDIQADTADLNAQLASGADVSHWNRRFTGPGFDAMLAQMQADPIGGADVLIAWAEYVAAYAQGVKTKAGG